MRNLFAGRSRTCCLLLAMALALLIGCQKDLFHSSAPKLPPEDKTFEEGADRKPTARTLYSLARILEKKGDYGQQRQVLLRIIEEYPRFLPAYNDLAKIYIRQGAHNHAAQTLLAGLTLSPRDPVLLNNLGMCWLNKKDYDTALECFEKAAAVAPANAQYRSNMAVALGLMGRYEESLALFLQVLPADEARYNLAVLAEARNDHELAAEQRKLADELAGRQSTQ